ncbi:MAG: hypothetical protein GY869_15680 [Planctomycetes bacterium]|nr:hypothetical protein [Planctomycetota bacterium]
MEKKETFKVSKYNGLYLGIVLLVFSVLLFSNIAPDLTARNPTITHKIAVLTSLILWPLFISWIFWRIFKKSSRAGSIAFAIMLTLAAHGQILRPSNTQNNTVALDNFRQDTREKYNNFLEDPNANPIDIEGIYNEGMDAIGSAARNKNDKIFVQVTQETMQENFKQNLQWLEYIDRMVEPEYIDWGKIETLEDLNQRKQIAQDYIHHSKEYIDYWKSTGKRMLIKFQETEIDQFYLNGAMDGFLNSFNANLELLESASKCHVERGQFYIEIFDLLETQWEKWELNQQSKILVFEEDEASQLFNSIGNQITIKESQLMELSKKLVDIL